MKGEAFDVRTVITMQYIVKQYGPVNSFYDNASPLF